MIINKKLKLPENGSRTSLQGTVPCKLTGNGSLFSLFLVFLIIFIVGFLSLNLSKIQPVEAGAGDNISGWAWSENVGWISFNNTSGGGAVDYGVNVDTITGEFSGYAWSESIGWISFNTAELAGCPSGTCEAKLNLMTNEVSGWARALAGESLPGGWDGWISLRGSSPDYGVSLSTASKEFEGWAWGSDVIGWISFNCLNQGVCGSSDYKVATDLNIFPNQPVSGGETWKRCREGTPQVADGITITFNWTYSDPEGDPQTAYEIWVDEDSNFTGVKFNYLVEDSSSTAYTLDLTDDDEGDWLSELAWGDTYYWKVKTRDSNNNWSEFSIADSFPMPLHAYPKPNFSPSPSNPLVGQEVTFVDSSKCYLSDGSEYDCKTESTPPIYAWDFDYDTGVDDNTKGDSSHTYTEKGNYTIMLWITDDVGTCSTDVDLLARIPSPKWKEVSPF